MALRMTQQVTQTFVDGKPTTKVIINCLIEDPEGKDPTKVAHAIEVDDFKGINGDLKRARKATIDEMKKSHTSIGDFLKNQK